MLGLYLTTLQMFGYHTCYVTLAGLKWYNADQPGLYVIISPELQVLATSS